MLVLGAEGSSDSAPKWKDMRNSSDINKLAEIAPVIS